MKVREYDDAKYDNLKILQPLGNGAMGRVFVCSLGKQHYALKISKLIPSLMKPKSGEVWRELQFYTNMSAKMKKTLKLYLIDYKIVDNCNALPTINKRLYQHPITMKNIKEWPAYQQAIHRALIKSPFCLLQVMPILRGNSLRHLLDETMKRSRSGVSKLKPSTKPILFSAFSKKQYYEWLIDILKQLQLLHKTGYIHGDVHPGNIMVLDSGDAVLIDYGLVNSPKWSSKVSLMDDCDYLFYFTYMTNHYEEHVRMNAIHGNKYQVSHAMYQRDLKKFLKTEEARYIAPLCEKVTAARRHDMMFSLAEMLLPDFIKHLTCGRYANEIIWHELWLINIEDALYMLRNIDNLSKIIARLERSLRSC